jgi:hypothetical protein
METKNNHAYCLTCEMLVSFHQVTHIFKTGFYHKDYPIALYCNKCLSKSATN